MMPNGTIPDDLVEIVGDNELAMDLAGEASREAGFSTEVLDYLLEGEAAELARELVGWLLETNDDIDVVWSGGETTVTVRGDGNGGRNTEFALSAALELDRLENDDGSSPAWRPTARTQPPAAPAPSRAEKRSSGPARWGLDPESFLLNNDSATFFEQAGGLVITGPTGTNVNDLYVGMRNGESPPISGTCSPLVGAIPLWLPWSWSGTARIRDRIFVTRVVSAVLQLGICAAIEASAVGKSHQRDSSTPLGMTM